MNNCQRCHIETLTTTGSMFNTDMICMECKKNETQHPRYDEAVRKEWEEVQKGNLNFEGIGWSQE